MHSPNIPHTRLYLLIAFLCVVLGLYTSVLYDTQVRQHDYYMSQSIRTIARQENVIASRGIITDRTGQTLVSNRSTYSLTFDVSRLKAGQDSNTAILRLLELCESQDITWTDTLPVSAQAPFVYTLDTATTTQRRSFFSYLRSIKGANTLLSAYILSHPELSSAEGSEENPLLSASELLDGLSPQAVTADFLSAAGLTAPVLMELLEEELAFPSTYSTRQRRMVAGVQYDLAIRKLGTNTAYVLVEDIDTEFISLLSDGRYAGAQVNRGFIRQYNTTSAAHILGTVSRIYKEDMEQLAGKGYDGEDWIGRTGVEKAFESYLKGTDGRRIVSTNADGKITGEFYATEPQPGNTVELTIDIAFQQAVEAALAQTVDTMNAEDGDTARGAGAAVLKVGSGEVLALASYPSYDPADYLTHYNEIAASDGDPLFNRATSGTYAPGSTLKPATAIAALESGVTNLREKVRDTGYWTYPSAGWQKWGFWCWNHAGHGLETVTDAITDSCNSYFGEMGYRMGLDTLNSYYSALGLGRSTGIEIGDDSGRLATQEPGQDQAPWAAYGQSDQLYTPIQLANYIATMLSGGTCYQAHLLKSVKSYDNAEILAVGNTTPTNRLEIDPENLAAVKEGMHNLTTSTLWPYFQHCVVSAGAKTGTAQVFANTKNNGVFVCFAPYENPEIAVAIVIERGGSGGALASTAVNILNAYFTAGETGAAIVGEHTLLP